MAHLIQLEVQSGGGSSYDEIWVNADMIVGMFPRPKGARVYFTHPVLPPSVIDKVQTWIDVRESPKQIRDKVIAERSTRMRKGWLSRSVG